MTEHYNQLSVQKKRESAPDDILFLIRSIHSNWKYWIEEFFCDLFALFLLGPAYAWSHLHLCAKKSDNIYNLSQGLPQSHPSDEARMRISLMALEALGFDSQRYEIDEKWRTVMGQRGSPVVEYQYAYPDSLLQYIVNVILAGMRQCGFSIVSEEIINNGKSDDIRNTLNGSWKTYWTSPSDFRRWEINTLNELKTI